MRAMDLFPDENLHSGDIVFLRRLDSKNSFSWLRTVSAMANSAGGTLLVGAEGPEAETRGLDRAEAEAQVRLFSSRTKALISPLPDFRFSFPGWKEGERVGSLARIEIGRGPSLPVALRTRGVWAVFIRMEGRTAAATAEQIRALALASETTVYDTLPTRTRFRPEDFKTLYRVYEERNGRPLSRKALESVDFYDRDGFLRRGSLLFADGCQEDNTLVRCRAWRGRGLLAEERERKGQLLDLLDFAIEFVRNHSKTGYIKLPIGRKEVASYPLGALTQALVNSLVHRNYLIMGSQIDIDVFQDRLEVTSPGSFPDIPETERRYDLAGIPSKRRNPLICDVFSLCRLMEKSGTGFEKIIEDYRPCKKAHRPYIMTRNQYSTLVLKDVTVDQEGNFDGQKLRFQPVPGGSRKRDDEILGFCYAESRSLREIAARIGLSKSSYLIREVIDPLIEAGCLVPTEKSAHNPRQRYRTNQDKVTIDGGMS